MGSFKAFLLAAVLLVASGNILAQKAANGFRFNDSADQAGFIEAMRKSGVQFNVRDDGTPTYSPADEARVAQIRSKFLEDNFLPSSHFPNPALETKVVAALDASKISHGIRVRDGKRYITWAKDDDKQASTIIAAVIKAWVEND